MHFIKKNQGGVLLYVVVVSIAMLIALTALLSASGIEGINVANEYRNINRFFAANSGLEVLRGMLYYDNRDTFESYLEQKEYLEVKQLPWDGYNITWTISNNNIEDPWSGGMLDDADGIYKISSTAYEGEAWKSKGLRLDAQVMLLMATKFSFASNCFGAAYMTGTQHWFGNIFWYAPKGALPNILGGSDLHFHGSLTSWELPSSMAGCITYEDGFTTHKAYKYKPPEPFTTGSIYTKESGPLTPAEEFTDGEPFVPLPGIEELEEEFGDVGNTSSMIGMSCEQKIGYFTNDPTFTGAVSGDVLPDRVELFFSPDGYVWWRNCGEGPDKWRKEDIPQGNGTVIYVKGDVWVKGVINKRMVVASGNDIFLNGNIINSDFYQAHLLIISHDDIYFEVRKEVTSDGGLTYKILEPLADATTGSAVPVDTNTQNYIAEPVFSDVDKAIIDFPDYINEIKDWMERPGALPLNTLFEASLMSVDRMVATSEFKEVSEWLWNNGGGTWKVKGLYFIGEIRVPPVDHVTNWTHDGGVAYYDEHPNALLLPPPFGGTIHEATPVYRMDGSYWRMSEVDDSE